MRFEQRVCDLCGSKSELVLTREPHPMPLAPAQSMEARGWDTVGGLDRCPGCAWLGYTEPHRNHEPVTVR